MSTVDRDEIRDKWLRECAIHDYELPYTCSCPEGDYRPVMMRLVEEIDRLRAALADEQATHAKTISNFEESTESAIEERDRLRHALDDARRERTRARQAFIELVNTGRATGGDNTDG